MTGAEVRSLSFRELWQASDIAAPVAVDGADNFPVFLRVTPTPGAGPDARLVFRRRRVVAGRTPVGWLQGGQLTEAVTVAAEAMLAVDRRWLETQLAADAAPAVVFVCAGPGLRERDVKVVFRPFATRFIAPRAELHWTAALSLDSDKPHDEVELARVALTFEARAKLFRGVAPALSVHARAGIRDAFPRLDLHLIEQPPDTQSGEETRIEAVPGEGDPAGQGTHFVTSLATPEEGEGAIVYRLVARQALLRRAIAGSARADGKPLSAGLDMRLDAALGFEDGARLPLADARGRIAVTYSPQESVTLARGAESVRLQLGADAPPRLFAPLRAHRTVTAGRQTLMMQPTLDMTVAYHGGLAACDAVFMCGLFPDGGDAPAETIMIGPLSLASGEVARFGIPVHDMLVAAAGVPALQAMDLWSYRIAGEVVWQDGPSRHRATIPPVDLPIEIEGEPDWLLCVDLGTSAVAVWCGLPDRIGRSIRQLPLGAWLERIDPLHDESSLFSREDAPAAGADRAQASLLIPSHVGLASDFNLRDRFDVLSLGDLTTAGATETAVAARLTALGRRYDVSVPFPSTSEMNRHFDRIVFEPKRKLITCAESDRTIEIGAEVLERVPGDGDGVVRRTRRIDLLDLFADYFDELATFLVPRVLDWAAATGAAHAPAFRPSLDRWLDGANQLQLIVTHPTGMSHEKRRLYRLATQRFAASLQSGRGLPRAGGTRVSVLLIPESLAAVRFGISRFVEERGRGVDGEHLFVALDIGAGTYDVTVLSATLLRGEPVAWQIHSHFGIAVGGIELDRALTSRIAEIVRRAALDPALQRHFQFAPFELPGSVADVARARDDGEKLIGMRFLHDVKAAKVRLTDDLMRSAGRPYGWEGASPAPVLSVRLGETKGRPDEFWPVRIAADSREGATFGIAGEPHAGLRIAAGPDGSKTVRLELAREALAGGALGNCVELLGRVLPRIARAAAQRYGNGSPPHWIITGRTALWPDLYQSIARIVAGSGAGAPGSIGQKPYAADDMKVAVIQGAQMMASEPHLGRGERVYNPLAVVRMTADQGGTNRIAAIDYIPGSEKSGRFVLGRTYGRFQLVRAVPGLDAIDPETGRTMLELLEAIPDHPALWRPVSHVRDLRRAYPDGGLEICWETDGDDRTTISIVSDRSGTLEVFGPYGEETVYGYG